MPRYTDASKERVRDAVDFAELVTAKTGDLRRTGPSGFMGLCPFHDERTGSFSVDASKKLFHCFGCGESGDVFAFVSKTEGVGFGEALELLADRTGVELELEAEDPQAAERRVRRERLLELLERTAAFYVRTLWESPEAAPARDYLASRGLAEATLREFRVGYAPSAYDTVLNASRRAGYSNKEAYDAGIVQRSQDTGRLYDRFRRRITFPLADMRGRVVGFGARAMSEGRGPKYLNTAENEVFHKGGLVYAADIARSHAAKAGSVVLCEGYTDVLALHQAGLRNAVATMGTALTEAQVVELGRMAATVQMALDADSAGQEAMLRAARVAAGRKLELRVVPLPEGRDPADVVASDGADAMRSLVERSVPFVRFRVERALRDGDAGSAEGKDRILDDLRPVFAGLGASVLRDELLQMVSDRLDIAPELAQTLLGGASRRAVPARGDEARPAPASVLPSDVPPDGPAPTHRAPQADRRGQTERTFLALCLALPDTGRETLSALDPDTHFTDATTRRAARWLADHLDAPLDGLPADDPDLAALLPELAARARSQSPAPAELEVESLQLELARLDRAITRAPGGSRRELAARRVEVQHELDLAMDRAMG